jgi:hypothetical protein
MPARIATRINGERFNGFPFGHYSAITNNYSCLYDTPSPPEDGKKKPGTILTAPGGIAG